MTFSGTLPITSASGAGLHSFISKLYPLCRSITGNGVRATLKAVGELIPVQTTELASGTQVFDWIVPKEWNIRDAYIKNSSGQRVVDFRQCNLHVLNYSSPVQAVLPSKELKEHLHTLPERPNWIPYRTTYYKEDWGFCLSHNQLQSLPEGEYEVCIDSSLEDGSLTLGETYLEGTTTEEVLVSCHVCHPSLANDNLSGLAIAAHLAKLLAHKKRHYSYRFLFIPGTIGAICWLALNQDKTSRVRHGLVLTCLGDDGGFHYKKSRRGNAIIDRAAAHVLGQLPEPGSVIDFSPYGYDERQYCSPGFNLPVGCLMRSVWGQFPEYHTSADNLEFVKAEKLEESLRVCTEILEVVDSNRSFVRTNPFCEPQLGRRGLYCGSEGGAAAHDMSARLWVLNLSDGSHSLLDIAERSGLPYAAVRSAAELLRDRGLVRPVEGELA